MKIGYIKYIRIVIFKGEAMEKNNTIFNLLEKARKIEMSDILDATNAEINFKNGKMCVKTTLDDVNFTLELAFVQQREKSTKKEPILAQSRKMNYLEEVKKMLIEGKKQKDIASDLGISAAYVTQLKKEIDKNRSEDEK